MFLVRDSEGISESTDTVVEDIFESVDKDTDDEAEPPRKRVKRKREIRSSSSKEASEEEEESNKESDDQSSGEETDRFRLIGNRGIYISTTVLTTCYRNHDQVYQSRYLPLYSSTTQSNSSHETSLARTGKGPKTKREAEARKGRKMERMRRIRKARKRPKKLKRRKKSD